MLPFFITLDDYIPVVEREVSARLKEPVVIGSIRVAGLPLPLTAVQILYVNLATDGLPALALAVDPPERDLMRRKPRDPRIGVFTRPVVAILLIAGLWSALVNMSLFTGLLQAGRPQDCWQTGRLPHYHCRCARQSCKSPDSSSLRRGMQASRRRRVAECSCR